MADERTTITAEEYRALLAEEGRRRNKYGAEKAVYNGETYDSKAEAAVAEILDRLREDTTPGQRRPVMVERQPEFALIPGLRYRADFRVTWDDGRATVLEVKGYETQAWRIKQKLMAHSHPGVDLRVVRRPLDVVIIAEERGGRGAG